MNKLYELAVVFDGKITPAKRKAEVEKLEKMIGLFEGKVVSVDDWGVKDLAYPIKKLNTGYYMIFTLDMPGAAAKHLTLKLRLEEQIIRHLLVKVEPAKVEKKAKAETKTN